MCWCVDVYVYVYVCVYVYVYVYVYVCVSLFPVWIFYQLHQHVDTSTHQYINFMEKMNRQTSKYTAPPETSAWFPENVTNSRSEFVQLELLIPV